MEFDATAGLYRAKLRTELTASGPALQLNADRKTWRLASSRVTTSAEPLPGGSSVKPPESQPQPQPQPQPEPVQSTQPIRYTNIAHYTWDQQATNFHGYVVMHRKQGVDPLAGPEIQYAFIDTNGLFVSVDPPGAPINQPAQQIPAWTDRDIWDFYGLHGAQVDRFRAEVASTGTKPQWALPQTNRRRKHYLINELRRWISPEKTQDEFARLMAPHSYEQLSVMLDNVQLKPSHLQSVRAPKRPLIDEQPGPSASAKRPRQTDTQPTDETGIAPLYVEMSRQNALLREQLLEQLQVRMNSRGAHKTLAEVATAMKPYNLSNRQLTQMLTEIPANGSVPQWAQNHKLSSMDETNLNRFDDTYEELLPEILSLRNNGQGFTDFNANYTRPYLDGLLTYAGYKRNKHNCLYRTDIPAMFRGDDRTPFEFARDGHMLPRKDLGEGSTTQKAVSATFSLHDAKKYISHFGKQSGIEELLYNTQYHKYPGDLNQTPSRDMDSSDGDSASDIDGDSDDGGSGSGSGSDNESGRMKEKDYYPKRQNQNIAFCYLFDTRNIEIVPARENYHFNRHALDSRQPGDKTWFPDDDLEGHISVSSRGFSADRIWLVNSTFTRAARVNDIYSQSYDHAGHSTSSDADVIEEMTWAGANNMRNYDALIDQVAAANKPVLNFPAGKEVFSNDVVFTPDLTTPTTA
ncbi:hypothetical protein BK659_01995 [Pseudomonas brassicacearum]|uniref:Uncharacterized protein n=1 Tax=Pseudomonas brassicacearum TaxID=930166 RepID=A0A423HCS2_9PSED|nr:hypothetical protein BK659_01995 [Pseudomonas brassicacearum]